MKIVIREDGAHVVPGADTMITPIVRVETDGSVTLRIPERDVEVESMPKVDKAFDMSDVDVCRIAVIENVITVEDIRSVRPIEADKVAERTTKGR